MLFALLGVLSCCVHVVDLRDVETLQAGAIPDYRRVDVQTSTVHSSDIISLSASCSDNKACNDETKCKLSIRTSCKDPDNLCQGEVQSFPENHKITFDDAHPRIAAFTLEMVRYVQVSIDGPSQNCQEQKVIDFDKFVGRPWDVVKQRIENSWGNKTKLNLTRALRPDERAFPGDRVTIVAEHLAMDGFFSFQSSTERVNRWGELNIPQLTLPTSQLPDPIIDAQKSFGQLIMQQQARTRATVTVWNPDGNSHPTISHIERCLALRLNGELNMEHVPEQLKTEVKSCLSLGIVSHERDLAKNNFVRYRLDLEQEWSIILTDGRRFERPLVLGESVADAVRRAVRDLTGDDRIRRTHVVIDPRPELRARPFTSILEQRQGYLDNVLLISGDVVHLTNFAPVQHGVK